LCVWIEEQNIRRIANLRTHIASRPEAKIFPGADDFNPRKVRNGVGRAIGGTVVYNDYARYLGSIVEQDRVKAFF
jgi:hypothetical protein